MEKRDWLHYHQCIEANEEECVDWTNKRRPQEQLDNVIG